MTAALEKMRETNLRKRNMNGEVKPRLELISLFSIPIVKTNINRNFTEKEIDCIANIPVSKNPSDNTQGSQSADKEIFDSFEKELKDINLFCEHEINRYLEDIEGVNTDITNLHITHAWLSKVKPQECTDVHTHGNSHLSGVLYIHCLPNDSIQFINMNYHPRSSGRLELPKKETTVFTAKTTIINIKEGDLILFPSWIPHQVGMNETKNKERISLSFDTFPIRLPYNFSTYF